MKRILATTAIALCSTAPLAAAVELPAILSDNMILQQQTDATLWGWAEADKEVTITASWLTQQPLTTQANDDGYWEAKIATPTASYDPQWITFDDGDIVRRDNILIGEVWFASGQSNMEMPLNGFWNCPIEGGNEAIATAAQHPGVRFVNVERPNGEETRYKVHKRTGGEWQLPTPGNAQRWSATAYYYARMMTQTLNVPVGVISCAWGGSWVEGWLPREIVETYKDIDLDKQMKHIKTDDGGEYWLYSSPIVMYNGMLKPVSHYTIKGFLWYQGESNVGREKDYPTRLKTMVELWRDHFDNDELPFYIVEIAPWRYGNGISAALFRESQHKASQLIPHSAFVCTNDMVYPHELNQIHPRKKEEIGKRLAYTALEKTYGIEGIVSTSPSYKSMTITGDTIEVAFNNAAEGLSPWNDITGFELAGEDRIFHPATATLNESKKTIWVHSAEVPAPVAVRYCFRDFQIGNLQNHRCLPVIPFRSDNW